MSMMQITETPIRCELCGASNRCEDGDCYDEPMKMDPLMDDPIVRGMLAMIIVCVTAIVLLGVDVLFHHL